MLVAWMATRPGVLAGENPAVWWGIAVFGAAVVSFTGYQLARAKQRGQQDLIRRYQPRVLAGVSLLALVGLRLALHAY